MLFSPAEHELERRLRAEPAARWIKAVPHGLRQGYDPSLEDSRALAAGRLLLLSSFSPEVPVSPISRANCEAMNSRILRLCGEAAEPVLTQGTGGLPRHLGSPTGGAGTSPATWGLPGRGGLPRHLGSPGARGPPPSLGKAPPSICRFGGDRKAFYEAAGLDRRLFSKMVSYEGYAPSKETAIAVALAARLTLDEARDLLHVARYALSDRIPADIVYAACFRHRVYERAHVRALLGECSRGRIATKNAL